MQISISVDPWGCILGAVLLLLVPLPWLIAAVFAALIHECFHALAIWLCGSQVLGVRVGPGGTIIDTDTLSSPQELFCAIAGPAGSLLLLSLCHIFPKLALCAGVQGLYNLLPVYPLDGGRALLCLLRMTCPKYADTIGKTTARVVWVLLTLLCLYGTVHLSLGLFPVFLLLIPLINAFQRKRPCKRRQIGVQ